MAGKQHPQRRERWVSAIASLCAVALGVGLMLSQTANAQEAAWPTKTHYRTQEVNGNRIFYREAGVQSPDKPTIVLLHGYPSSSHYFRELIPLLSGRYHVIAPDNLGSGYSDRPDPKGVTYTFDLLADHIHGLIEALDIKQAVFFIQDFGAPVGFRVMMRDPSKLKGIIAQNGNAYLEGTLPQTDEWFQKAQRDRSPENVKGIYDYTGPESVKQNEYLRYVKGKEHIMSPDTWTHDNNFLGTERGRDVQVQLFQDYNTNLQAYPEWQAFLREHQPPTLLVWGKHDQTFLAAGAEAYLKDLPNAELHLLDAGHFAVEEKPVEIAKHIIQFLEPLQ